MIIPTIIEQFDWSKIGADILSKAIEVILISILFYLLNIFGQKLINRTTEHYLNKENTSNNRISTIHSLLKNALF